jgi:hypothetical protein
MPPSRSKPNGSPAWAAIPPVDDVDLAEVSDHHVLRLEIAMHDAAAVREVNGLTDLSERLQIPLEQIARSEDAPHAVFVVHAIEPGRAFDALEDELRQTVGSGDEIVDRDDVRVLERPGQLAFAHEPRHRARIASSQRLDGDLATDRPLGGEEDDAHARLRRSCLRRRGRSRALTARRAARCAGASCEATRTFRLPW